MTIILAIIISATLALTAYAAWSDWVSLKIPNIIPFSLCMLFLSAVILQEFLLEKDVFYTSLQSQLFAALLVFSVTAVLFSLNVFGAGDAKLLTALSLWTGFAALPQMIFWMAVVGGVLAACAIFLKRQKMFPKIPANFAPQGSWLAQLQAGRNAVPYGVAIFAGLIFAYGQIGYFNPQFWAG